MLPQWDIDDLKRVLQQVDGRVALDLVDLHSVDRAAVALLREILQVRDELYCVSPYVYLLLKSQSANHRSRTNTTGKPLLAKRSASPTEVIIE
jgi:hypothetical protein